MPSRFIRSACTCISHTRVPELFQVPVQPHRNRSRQVALLQKGENMFCSRYASCVWAFFFQCADCELRRCGPTSSTFLTSTCASASTAWLSGDQTPTLPSLTPVFDFSKWCRFWAEFRNSGPVSASGAGWAAGWGSLTEQSECREDQVRQLRAERPTLRSVLAVLGGEGVIRLGRRLAQFLRVGSG